MAAEVGLIAVVYWPVHMADLVWDDKFYLYNQAWLRHGSDWMQVAFRGFFDWKIYFRPLVVALFTVETRLFDLAPAPMHLLSLGLHLLNTILVGAFAQRLLIVSNRGINAGILTCVAVLVYGLHPALIEPVAWISSQSDLLVTLFMLLGVLANISALSRAARSITVALCFFLAACSKESAASFPLLLLVVDWLHPFETHAMAQPWQAGRVRLRQQWPIYLSVLVAGVAYLSIRYLGLGMLMGGSGHAAWFSLSHLQMICFTYLAYWKLLIWPMTGLNPLHIVPEQQFADFGAISCSIDCVAILIASAGICLLYKRKPLGGLVVGVSAALLPVLHVLPTAFDESIYHERYAMTAIAVACAFLPLVIAGLIPQRERIRPFAACCAAGAALWLLLAAINIRVTLPLWSDEVRLWKWALRQNPGSILAEDCLLSTYIERNDVADAQPLADLLMQNGRACAKCMLNVAFLAITQRDEKRTSTALQEAKRAMDTTTPNHALTMGYILASGNLSELQKNQAHAEEAYNTAIALDPLSPEAYMNLAFLRIRQGKLAEARTAKDTALSLSATSARARRQQEFEEVQAASKAPTLPAQLQH